MADALCTLALLDSAWLMAALNALLLPLLLLTSASFSGSETVLFSLTPAQLQHDARSHNPLRRLAAQLMKDRKRVLMVILLGNTAVNVLLYAATFLFLERFRGVLGAWAPLVGGIVTILVVVVCAEVSPKILAVRLAPRLAPYAALLVKTAGLALEPIAQLIDVAMAEPLTRLMLGGRRGEPAEHDLSTDELRALLELSRRHGVINPTEDTFLRAAIALNSLRIRDVMVPRVELRAYDVNASPSGLRDLMRSTRLKRIPVYDGAIDNIVGLVYAKVLFLEPDKKLRDLLMPVRFVPEMISCEQLLEHFRKTRTQLAIVVDEYGGVAGLVTLEDVLEEIVGDIHDPEEKPGEPEILQLSPTEYEVSGMLGVRFWAETFGLPRLVDRVSTVGGLVAARLGRTARAGDAVRFGNLELRVAQVDRRRVKRVRLRLLQGAPS